jgi:repressor LexA
MALKERTKDVFVFVHDHTREKGMPPTLREIGERFGITSTNGVRFHLEALERCGYVRRRKRIARGLEVTPSGIQRIRPELAGRTAAKPVPGVEEGIPILGRVAAGTPLLAEENLEGRVSLDAVFPSRVPRFALRVNGDSMMNAGILDGDLVIVRRTEQAESGEIVVALLGDEATVKTFRKSGGRVELWPANPSFKKIPVREGDDVRVLGVVIGLLRPAPSRRGSLRT